MRKLDKGDLQFLKELQEEMLTQDTCSQADPRYWVLAWSERSFGVEESRADGSIISIKEDTIESMDEVADLILAFDKEICDKNGWHDIDVTVIYDLKREYLRLKWTDSEKEEQSETLYDLDDVLGWLMDYYPSTEPEIVYYRKEQKTSDGPLFLTKKAAEEHLSRFGYNYPISAHPYAQTAFRSPEIEKLYDILHNVDFSKLEAEL